MKKLQVFISSTYNDLIEERQAAVEAILSAGHIPAGMELFSAGNQSQLETIKRWIEGSDVYLLILGGRYGAIEPKSQKSYTQLEYEYAIDKGIPIFAVVINESALEAKVKKDGPSVLEMANQNKYREFKELVLTKMCKFFDDIKDIKLAIHETLLDFGRQYKFSGWVSGKAIEEAEGLIEENRKLLKENKELQAQITKLTKGNGGAISDEIFITIKEALKQIKVKLPPSLSPDEKEINVYSLFVSCQEEFAIGVSNQSGVSDTSSFLFYKVAPHLMAFNLAEKAKVPSSVYWQKIHTSKHGYEFLKYMKLQPDVKKNESSEKMKPLKETKTRIKVKNK